MKRVALLNGKAQQDEVLLSALASNDIDAMPLEKEGHALEASEQLANDGAEFILACGGDGTLNEVINGVMASKNRKCAVGTLPYGTANDFVRSICLPPDLNEAVAILSTLKATKIDLGRLNDRYFINVVSGGFGAQVTAETPKPLKDLLGGLAYTIVGASKALEAEPASVEVNSEDFQWNGAVGLITIANARFAGGGYAVAPYALLDDGMLNMRIIPYDPTERYGPWLVEFLQQKVNEVEGTYFREASNIRIHCSEDFHVNLDGEKMVIKDFEITVVPLAIPFLIPEQTNPDQCCLVPS